MVQLTDSLKEFLWENNYREIIPLLMFGHMELFTEEIQKEYIEWMKIRREAYESLDNKICALGRDEIDIRRY